MLLWAAAAKHFNGSGLEHGISGSFSSAVLAKYRKEGIHDRAAALETVLSGACWSP